MGQHFPDGAVFVFWCTCADRDRRWHGRFSQLGAGPTGITARLAADTRANLAILLFQLHVHSTVCNRVSTHPDLLPHREKDEPVQEDGDLLPALHSCDLAAVR